MVLSAGAHPYLYLYGGEPGRSSTPTAPGILSLSESRALADFYIFVYVLYISVTLYSSRRKASSQMSSTSLAEPEWLRTLSERRPISAHFARLGERNRRHISELPEPVRTRLDIP
jgi:hypothetical protein